VDGATVVRRRRHLRYSLDSADGEVVLRLADRTVAVPTGCRTAVVALLDGGEHRVDALPGITADDAVVLVRRLLREAVLVPVPA
jgi:hypothetical protein